MQATATPPQTPAADATTAAPSTPGFDPKPLLARQRAFFASGATRELRFRKAALTRLRDAIRRYEADIHAALHADLAKPGFEAYATETGFVLEDLNHIRRNLGRWMRSGWHLGPLSQFPSWGRTYAEPYGTTLVIAPWNYPFQLAVSPLVGAVAAGNTVVVKPSELAPATSAVLARLIGETFAPEHVAVVEGGIPETQALLAEPFDYLFYTGSTAVGKIIARAAAEHLTPTTLELGGKSPCIVTADAPLRLAARRIAWGKFLNAGQTCVAPDYLLVDRRVLPTLVTHLKAEIAAMYGTDPLSSPDYGRIVNQRHFERLRGYLSQGEVVYGGQTDAASLRMAPTLLLAPDAGAAVLQDEIFGPVLPILPYDELAEATAYVNRHPKPLALYVFTADSSAAQTVLSACSFGGGCVNDVVVHLADGKLPFGGVGHSGMGAYHGRHSFNTFSHRKGVLTKATWFDLPVRYAPFRNWKERLLRLVVR